MKLSSLTAISPIDGRYLHQLTNLQPLFSEQGLIYYRLMVEIRWFEMLAKEKSIKELPSLDQKTKIILQKLLDDFSEADAKKIKSFEKTTNHDIKAVEYFLKEKFSKVEQLKKKTGFIHFGCTSEDINNIAYGLILKTARKECLLPAIDKLIQTIRQMTKQLAKIPMLSRTHGQPATPTTLGKEFANVLARIKKQTEIISKIKMMGKINGAVGNYNAHTIAYPKVNWEMLAKQFVTNLGLTFNSYTTQIEPHDYMAELSHAIMRLNTVLIDFCRDNWLYISKNYFDLKLKQGEVGSSTMPHKVNPIDFENAEGNLGLANGLFNFFAEKLPVSRWQRDLSDSTVLRNLGVAFAHSLLAYQAILKGLNKLTPNNDVIAKELDEHWEVLAEAAQTIMRRDGVEKPYETLKKLTHGKSLDKATWLKLVDNLALPQEEKERLKKLTPKTYLGKASSLAEKI